MAQRGLFSSSLIYGIGAVANKLATLLFLPIFTSYLTPADYGVIGLLNTLGMFLIPLFSFGLGTSIGISYFASSDQNTRDEVIRSAFAILLVSALCIALVSLTFGEQVSEWVLSSPDFSTHVLVTFIGIGFGLLAIPLQLRLQFENRPTAFVFISLLGIIGNLAFSFLLVAHLHMGALGLLMGTALGQAIIMFSAAAYGFRFPRLKDWLSPCSKELLVLGLPMIPSFFLLFFLQNAVRWPLEWQHGLHAVGLYTVGTNFGLAVSAFTAGVVAAWLPHALSKAESWEEDRKELAQNFLRYFAIVGYVVLIFFIGAQPLLKLFAADNFFPAWQVVGMAALTQFLISVFSLVLPPLYIVKKVRLVLIPQVASALVATVLMFWLVPFGIVGAALTVTISAVVLVLLTSLIVRRTAAELSPVPYDLIAIAAVTIVVVIGSTLSFSLTLDNFPFFCISALAILGFSAILIIKIAGLPMGLFLQKVS